VSPDLSTHALVGGRGVGSIMLAGANPCRGPPRGTASPPAPRRIPPPPRTVVREERRRAAIAVAEAVFRRELLAIVTASGLFVFHREVAAADAARAYLSAHADARRSPARPAPAHPLLLRWLAARREAWWLHDTHLGSPATPTAASFAAEHGVRAGDFVLRPARYPFHVLVVIEPRGRCVHLRVAASASVGELRGKLQEQEGVPPDRTQLLFGGRALKDDRTLGDYGVPGNAAPCAFRVARGPGKQPFWGPPPPSRGHLPHRVAVSAAPRPRARTTFCFSQVAAGPATSRQPCATSSAAPRCASRSARRPRAGCPRRPSLRPRPRRRRSPPACAARSRSPAAASPTRARGRCSRRSRAGPR